jgi:TctA family transporter
MGRLAARLLRRIAFVLAVIVALLVMMIVIMVVMFVVIFVVMFVVLVLVVLVVIVVAGTQLANSQIAIPDGIAMILQCDVSRSILGKLLPAGKLGRGQPLIPIFTALFAVDHLLPVQPVLDLIAI